MQRTLALLVVGCLVGSACSSSEDSGSGGGPGATGGSGGGGAGGSGGTTGGSGGAGGGLGGAGGSGAGSSGGSGAGGSGGGPTGGTGAGASGGSGGVVDAGLDSPASACADAAGNDAASPSLSWSGSIVGPNAPASGKVIVVWVVSSGSPDYGYYWGDGAFNGSTYTITFGSPPPPEAINSYGVGVGLLVLVDSGFAEPAGKIDDKVVFAHLLASNFAQRVIWRDASLQGLSWSSAFPDGYGVGSCCPMPGSFAGFVPVDPSTLSLYLKGASGQPGSCNWT